MALHSHSVNLILAIALLLATYQVACWLTALLNERSLAFWSVGPFGVSAAYLKPPSLATRILDALTPPAAVALVSYVMFYLARPPLVMGVEASPLERLGAALAPVALACVIQGLRLFGDLRFPVWGEARVLALIARSRSLGGRIHFTAAGRAFLRERFGATPTDFLRDVG